MPNTDPVSHRIYINQQKTCVWCTSNRVDLSRFCKKCKNAVNSWGHADGRKLNPIVYRPDEEKCKQILDLNRDSQIAQFALEFCQRYLDKASEQSGLVVNPSGFISELASRGVTAEEMFLRALAVYIYCYKSKRSPYMPKHQIGGAILTLRNWNRVRKVTGKARREVGAFILGHLEPVFKKFIEAMNAQALKGLEFSKMIQENQLKYLDTPKEFEVDNSG